MSEPRKKSGLLGTLKGMVFEETPSPKLMTPVSPSTPASVGVASVVPQQIEQSKVYQSLKDAVLSRDSAYIRVLRAFEALQSVLPDEHLRFRSALATVGASGLSSQEIAAALNTHLSALESEKARFADAMKQQYETSIGAGERECATIEQAMERSKNEIAHLQQEIAEQEAKKNSIYSDIAAKKAKFDDVKREFDAACLALSQKLEADKRRILDAASGS